ncbi:type IA DNA topoisomerase [Rhizobium laguerreae]|uniref:toprim domain-containing protein n=1 Tax=Rhizobium laguerreae TaxID=1076926 RepID=UPI001C926542|nr:toprim domain-containing protein [Rhizobium laguerreae]MBY3150976.1 type IA DNA topoisomerase [Rhizobium laguerreae]
MSNLFIIEAPRKCKTLQELLEKIGVTAKVAATKGHLYDMPGSLQVLGIDKGFRDFERKLIIPDIARYIRELAAEAKHVYVATDADQEGDVIAWDVAELIADIHPDPYRVRLKGMDEDSIRAALDETTLVNKRDAVPGRTRAIVDRMIGSVFSQNGIAVGRVSTGLLGLVKDNPPCSLRIRLVAPAQDGGRPWVAETDVVTPLDGSIAARLAKVRFPALAVGATASKPYTRPPGNMGDIMVRAGDELNMSPAEASSSLQRLYEAGRMTYPRAGSRGISRSALRKVHEVLKKSGYEFSADKVAEKKETDVHDAPHPIGKVEIQLDPTKQGFDEGLRTLVARDLVRSGQSHAVQLGIGDVAGRHLATLGFSNAVCDFVAKLHWRREVGQRYPGQEAWPKSTVIERRQDTVLLELAKDYGLGRPSTWAGEVTVDGVRKPTGIIDKFLARKLVDQNFQLTEKGRKWVAASPPLLLDPRISAYIEDACEKSLSGMMDHPEREPWEILAERIVSVLPPEIQQPLFGAIDPVARHPKEDPTAPFRQTTTVDDIMRATREKTYDYAPAMPSLTDY